MKIRCYYCLGRVGGCIRCNGKGELDVKHMSNELAEAIDKQTIVLQFGVLIARLPIKEQNKWLPKANEASQLVRDLLWEIENYEISKEQG